VKTKKSLFAAGLVVLFAIIGMTIVSSGIADAQQLRFGYVNSSVIMNQYEEAQRAQRQLETLAQGWENELRSMIEDLQSKYEDYQQKQQLMTEQARIESQQELVELEQRINQFQRERFGQGGQIVNEQERIFRPVRERILSAIESVAQSENLDIVLDKTDEVPVLLYAQSRYDITFKVLDILKRGNN
jgi:outer membrane protein